MLNYYKICIMSHEILTHLYPSFTPIKVWFAALQKTHTNSHLFLSWFSCALFFLYIFLLLSWVIHILKSIYLASFCYPRNISEIFLLYSRGLCTYTADKFLKTIFSTRLRNLPIYVLITLL